MEKYIQERERQARRARVSGGILTVAIHVALAVCFFVTGFTYLDPPPPEKTPIVIDFSEPDVQKPKQIWNGSRPQVEKPDPTQPINLVQKSEAQLEGTKANEAPEATVDDFGDVETQEPPREKPIDKRALFHAADNNTVKDTLAPQTAREPSDALKAGHASGNTTTGKTDGEPNAKVAGRSVNGTLPRPSYGVQADGKVVVKIWVDQYGNVTKAQAGVEGTTATDKTLWQAAYKAALGAHFNMDASAPPTQVGTITYIFRMR
jgi:hypothetical protein